MGSGFKLDVSQVMAKLDAFQDKFDVALYVFAQNGAQKMEGYAKQHRPWTDRSGAARQRLKGSAYRIDNGYRLEIAHGVYYGIYLELARQRRYAILEPTVQKVGREEIMPAFEHFVERTKI